MEKCVENTHNLKRRNFKSQEKMYINLKTNANKMNLKKRV